MAKSEQEMNPYEAPQTLKPFGTEVLSELGSGLAYADGEDLVFKKGFIPPRICLKTGEKVAQDVKPMPLMLSLFKMKNQPLLKLIEWAVLAFFLFCLLMVEDFKVMIAGTIFYWGYSIYNLSHGSIKLFYAKEIRAAEMKRSWKFIIPVVITSGLMIYGVLDTNYVLAIVGVILFNGCLFNINKKNVFKIVRGDKEYYRLANVHPKFLALYPKLNASDTDEKTDS